MTVPRAENRRSLGASCLDCTVHLPEEFEVTNVAKLAGQHSGAFF